LGSGVWGLVGAEGLKDFGEVVFGFRGGVAEGDGALKVLAGFGHTVEAGEGGSESFVKTRVVGVETEGEFEDGGSFVVSIVLEEEACELASEGGRAGGGVEAVAESLDRLVRLGGTRIGEGEIGALHRRALGLDAGLVEQVDDGGVVGIVNEIGGECVESSRDLGIEGESRAPFGFSSRYVVV